MPFIGKQPEVGAYQLIDSITTSATATYALTVDGSAYFPASARNLIVSLNGVTQAPESAYTVSGSDIVFASPLTPSDVIDYILVIGDAVDIGTPSDGTVGTSQMSYPLGNFSSTGIDDNATSTAITIDSNQRVGINTTHQTSPSVPLHVQTGPTTVGSFGPYTLLGLSSSQLPTFEINTDASSSGNIRFNDQNGLGGQISYSHPLDTMSFWSGGAERMTLNSSGTVAIGGTGSGLLQVLGASSGNEGGQIDIECTGTQGNYSIDAYTDDLRFLNGTTSGHMQFYKNNNSGVGVTIHGTGRIGIGTTGPSFPLDIRAPSGGGDTVARIHNQFTGSSDDAVLRLSIAGTTADSIIQFGDGGDNDIGRIAYHHADNSMRFFTGASEGMRLDASGRLMLNITSSSIQAPIRAQAFGATSAYYGYYFDAAGTSLSYVRADGLFGTGAAALSPYNFSTTGRDVYVNSSGQLGYLSSTRESKENIQPLENIEWLYSLSPVSFNYKEKDDQGVFTTEINDEVEYGLIAEEVEQVNTDLCFYGKDEEGNQTLAGVSYRKLIPVLTKAIQEQQTIIEDLQTRLSALEAN